MMETRRWHPLFACGLVVLLGLLLTLWRPRGATIERPSLMPDTAPAPTQTELSASGLVPSLPGNADRFRLYDGDVTALFTPGEMILAKQEKAIRWGVASPQRVEPQPRGNPQGTYNELVGSRENWRTNVPIYPEIVYAGIQPGIDLNVTPRFHGVKYSLHADAGIDVRSIRLRYEGVDQLRIVEEGAALEIDTAMGPLREDGLVVYQPDESGRRRPLVARYGATEPISNGWEYTLQVDGADPTLPVVIDPGIWWTRWMGLESADEAFGVATDKVGNIYVVGRTNSSDTAYFPNATPAIYRLGARGNGDVLVAKYSPTGAVQWRTRIGGRGLDEGRGIAVNDQGVFITGYTEYRTTEADNYPHNLIAFQEGAPTTGPVYDVFVTRLTLDGTSGDDGDNKDSSSTNDEWISPSWSTLVRGLDDEWAYALCLDGSSNVYVTGSTESKNLPGHDDASYPVRQKKDAFVFKLNSGGSLQFFRYLAGFEDDEGRAITVNQTGFPKQPVQAIHVVGWTQDASPSPNFPTQNAFQPSHKGAKDTFIAALGETGSVVWSSLLGGKLNDEAFGLCIYTDVDGGGSTFVKEIYVTGMTESDNITAPQMGLPWRDGGPTDAYVARISLKTGTSYELGWFSYLGGSAHDRANSIVRSQDGLLHLTGITYSTRDSFRSGISGAEELNSYAGDGVDSFYAALVPNATGPDCVKFAGFLGYSDNDSGRGIAPLPGTRDLIVAGYNTTTLFDPTASRDFLVARIDHNDPPVVTNDTATTPEDNAVTIFVLTNDSPGADAGQTLTLTSVTSAANGTVTFTSATVTYAPKPNFSGSDSFSYTVSDGNGGSATGTVTVTVTPVNDAPVANGQAVTTNEDQAKAITLSGTDVEGSSLTYSIVTGPTHGSLSGSGANRTYTPNENFNGADSFTFQANDGAADSAPATVTIGVTAVNDAPTITAISNQTVNEDVSTSAIPFTVGDVETAAGSLTISRTSSNTTLVPTANVVLGGSGANRTVTVSPAPNQSGTTTITVTVSDGAASNSASFIVTVVATNDPPTANNQSVTTTEDTAVSITLTGGDIDGDSLTYSIVAGPTHGTVSGTAPSVTYTPTGNYGGSDSFTFRVNDGTVNSATATVSITVTPTNDLPVATNDDAVVAEDSSATTINVLANDTTVPDTGEILTIQSASDPAHGTVVVTGMGSSLTYQPDPNWNGVETFSYTIGDGNGGTASATVRVTVTAANDPPIISGTPGTSVNEDTSYTFTPTATDADSGDALTFSIQNKPAWATFNTAIGVLTGTPTNSNVGSYPNILISVADAAGATASLPPFTIMVVNVNDPPIIVSTSAGNAYEGTVASVGATWSDVDDTTVTVTIQWGDSSTETFIPIGATFSQSHVYVQNGTYAAALTVTDGSGASDTENVIVIVYDQGPTAHAGADQTVMEGATVNLDGSASTSSPDAIASYSWDLGGAVAGPLTGRSVSFTALQNGSFIVTLTVTDADGSTSTDSLTLTVNDVVPTALLQGPDSTLEGSGVDFSAAGSFPGDPSDPIVRYEWDLDADGAFDDATGATASRLFSDNGSFLIQVRVTDEDGSVDTASLTIVVQNVSPSIAISGNNSLTEGSAFTGSGSFTDPGADTWTATVDYGNGPAALPLNPDKSFSLSHTYAADGSYPVTILVQDDDGGIASASLQLTVQNVAPQATDDAYAMEEDGALRSNVLLNDTDAGADTLVAILVSEPGNGSLAFNSDGSFDYTPNADFHGTDGFRYKANDGVADSEIATATVLVHAVNDPPVATPQTVTLAEDTAITISFAGTDPDGDSLTYEVVGQPSHGTLDRATYIPTQDFNGIDTILFRAFDGSTYSESVAITLTVTSVNDPPTATDDAATTPEDTPLTLDVLSNDSSAPDIGETLMIVSAAGPSHGTVTWSADRVTYTPALNFYGTDGFTYTIEDGNGASATATVNVTVSPVNDPPVAYGQGIETREDTSVHVRAPVTDVEGDPLTIEIVTLPGNGTLVSLTPTTWRYFPNPNFNGVDILRFRASDGSAISNLGSVSIWVTAVNDMPVADSRTLSTNDTTPLSITLSGSDVEGGPLAFAVLTPPTYGSLSGTAPDLVYVANTHFHGTDSFTFRVTDGEAGESSPATVAIVVHDTIAPQVTFQQTPPDPSGSPDASFAFTANESVEFLSFLDGTIVDATEFTQLSDGIHTYEVRGVDAAGNVGTVSYTWTVDTSSPEGTTPNDGLGPDIDFQLSMDRISANWSPFQDEGTRIARYEWAIGTTPGGEEVRPLTAVGLELQATATELALEVGTSYYVTVRAFDEVGNHTSLTSDGVTVTRFLVEPAHPCWPLTLAEAAGSWIPLAVYRLSASTDVRVHGLSLTGDGLPEGTIRYLLDVNRDGWLNAGDLPLGEEIPFDLLVPAGESRDILVVGSFAEGAGFSVRLDDVAASTIPSGPFPIEGPRITTTPATGTLWVEPGSALLEEAPVAPGERDVEMAQIQLRASSLSAATVTALITEADPTVVTNVRVVLDAEGNGIYDPNLDTPVSFPRTLPAGTDEKWLLLADFIGTGATSIEASVTADLPVIGCSLHGPTRNVATTGRVQIWNLPLIRSGASLPFAQDVPMLAFEIDCGMAEEVRIESIRIASDGSGDEPVEIARVVLWEDANGDRILSPGLDRMIAVTDGPFSADNGILNLAGLTEVIPPGERRVWFLTIHLWGWSAAGKNFQLFFDVAAKDSPIQVVGVSGPIRPTGGLVIAPHAWVDPLVGSSGTQREDSALGLCGGSVAGHPLSFWSFVVLAILAVFWKRR